MFCPRTSQFKMNCFYIIGLFIIQNFVICDGKSYIGLECNLSVISLIIPYRKVWIQMNFGRGWKYRLLCQIRLFYLFLHILAKSIKCYKFNASATEKFLPKKFLIQENLQQCEEGVNHCIMIKGTGHLKLNRYILFIS